MGKTYVLNTKEDMENFIENSEPGDVVKFDDESNSGSEAINEIEEAIGEFKEQTELEFWKDLVCEIYDRTDIDYSKYLTDEQKERLQEEFNSWLKKKGRT